MIIKISIIAPTLGFQIEFLSLEVSLAYSQNLNSLDVFYISGCICIQLFLNLFPNSVHSKKILSIHNSIQLCWHRGKVVKPAGDPPDIRFLGDSIRKVIVQLQVVHIHLYLDTSLNFLQQLGSIQEIMQHDFMRFYGLKINP